MHWYKKNWGLSIFVSKLVEWVVLCWCLLDAGLVGTLISGALWRVALCPVLLHHEVSRWEQLLESTPGYLEEQS